MVGDILAERGGITRFLYGCVYIFYFTYNYVKHWLTDIKTLYTLNTSVNSLVFTLLTCSSLVILPVLHL